MADQKVSELSAAATPLDGSELVPIVQAGVSKKVAVSDLLGRRARRHEWVNGIAYEGVAVYGTGDTTAAWTVTRITVASNGTVTTAVANSIAWSDRATATYV